MVVSLWRVAVLKIFGIALYHLYVNLARYGYTRICCRGQSAAEAINLDSIASTTICSFGDRCFGGPYNTCLDGSTLALGPANLEIL